MLATLLLVLAAAPLKTAAPSPISSDGRVAMPEGIRFRLPARFTYRLEKTDDGAPAFLAIAPDETGLVAVTAVRSDAKLPCEASDGEATVRPHRTARGLRACVVSATRRATPPQSGGRPERAAPGCRTES